jgi:hypothetical protein
MSARGEAGRSLERIQFTIRAGARPVPKRI